MCFFKVIEETFTEDGHILVIFFVIFLSCDKVYFDEGENGLSGVDVIDVEGDIFEDGPFLYLFSLVDDEDKLLQFSELMVSAEKVDL